MKRPYLAGLPPAVLPKAGMAASSILATVGMNTGNLLFTDALHRVIRPDQDPSNYRFDPGFVREHHDGIVIPAANWLNPRSNFGELAKRIESTGLPCVIVGLGSQSHSAEQLPEVNEGTLNLLKVAAERSRSISVRGRYTAKVLAHLGIRGFRITGCPSLLWRIDGPARVEKKGFEPNKVVLTGSRGIPNERTFWPKIESSRLSLLMSRLAQQLDLDFVAQAELPDLDYLLGYAGNDNASSRDYLCKVFATDDWPVVERFIVERMKVFFNVPDWIDYLSTRSFTVGTRLHGAIASLLAGTPALLIAHDARTMESAQKLRIPVRDSTEFKKLGDFDLKQLYDDTDFSEFNRSGAKYFRNFAEFFEENEVDCALAPTGIAIS
jgi:hypothetical protein